jgi:LysM repeat protein
MKSVLKGLKGALLGMLSALVSSGIVAGSLVLSFTEVGQMISPAQEPSVRPEFAITLPPLPVILPSEAVTSTPETTPSPVKRVQTATTTVTQTQISPPPPTGCPPPPGWSPLTVSPGDTLNQLAAAYGITAEALIQANCLVVSRLAPGGLLYVPGTPPPPPPLTCGPPPGWLFYAVRSGDTLFSLGRRLGVSVSDLQFANCLGNSTIIRAGQRLYVPFLPPLIPTRTAPPTSTQTASPLPPTSTPVPSATPTAEEPPVETLPPSIRPASHISIPEQQTGEPIPLFLQGNYACGKCVIG